jgi:hypothetical protein
MSYGLEGGWARAGRLIDAQIRVAVVATRPINRITRLPASFQIKGISLDTGVRVKNFYRVFMLIEMHQRPNLTSITA